MIIRRDLIQGTLEWSMARADLVTASDFGNIVTDDFAQRKGEMVKTYIATKCAERWMGAPLDGFGSWATDQGQILESEAIPYCALELNAEIDRVGLITTDDGRAACSPDGITGEIGWEIKCPQPVQHVKTLMARTVPKEHLPQIHFSMFVTGWKAWRFCSYRRGFPSPIFTVQRDEEIQEKIADALHEFLIQFDWSFERLCEINGGPPIRRPLTPIPKREPERAPLHEFEVTP